MSRSKTKPLLLVLVGILALAALLWTGAWIWLAGRLHDQVEAWIADRRADGWIIQHGETRRSGYPFEVRLVLPEPNMAHPNGASWAGPALAVSSGVLHPGRLLISAPGHHALRLPNGRQGYLAGQFDAGRLLVGVDLGLKGWRGMDWDLAAITAEGWSMGRLTGQLQPLPAGPLALAAQAQDVVLPVPPGAPLPKQLDDASLRAQLTQAGLLTALDPLVLDSWRQAGGVIELERLHLRWDDLSLTADGTAALDRDLQPVFASTATLRGFHEALDRLVQGGVLGREEADMAKLVLGLMARTPPEGGPPEITVPVTLQDRLLTLGTFPLFEMPEIRWGE